MTTPDADLDAARAHLAAALRALGFPDDVELERTPELVAGFLAELRPGPLPPVSPLPTRSRDLLVVRDLPFHSICAHHLLPFFGTVDIAVRPDGAIAGLGWFPRLVDALARQPQLQERLAAQLADAIQDAMAPATLRVRIRARQLCVEMRGARSPATFEVQVRRGGEDPDLDRAL